MTFLEKVKMLFKYKDEAKQIIKVASDVKDAYKEIEAKEAKPGYKSTEFYLVLVATLQGFLPMLTGHASDHTVQVTTAILAGAYALLRTLHKS